MLRYTSILGILLCIITGCETSGGARGPYRTADNEPGRDTETAKRLHADALDLIDAGELDEAESMLRRALEADITFGPAHNNLGKLLFDQGKLYAAAWEFQYAIQLMPYQPEPRNNLGLVLENAGKLDEAIDQYREAMKIQPDNPILIGNLARSKHRRGDKDQEQLNLLEQIVLKDTRTTWTGWARSRLANWR